MADGEILFDTLSVVIRNLKCLQSPWLEVRETLQKLKIWAKVRDNRCRLSEATVTHSKGIIMIFKDIVTLHTMESSDEKSIIGSMEAVTEGLRFLRNCCAETPSNQSSMVSSGLVELTKDVITTLLKPEFKESEMITEPARVVVRSALQLLGNIVVRNEETQQSVWNECFPHFFLSVLSSTDYSIQDCACMVIYNCLNTQIRLELVSNHSGSKILSHILHLCADSPQLQWGYFILDYLICNDLLPDMYEGIEFDPLSRIVLLDLFQVKLTDAMDKPAENSKEFNSSDGTFYTSLAYLAEKFENHAKDILHKLQELAYSSDDIFQVLIFTRLLRLISTATGLHGNVTGLQERLLLLEICVGLLRETNKPEVRDIFSNISSVPQGVDSGEITPSHGLKRDLVRVIGNMCYQHTANQNKVRKLEGIPLMLDHCNVDDHNPYICQWAIFAVRNLLENNPQNQSLVWALDCQGLADTSRLRQFGVEAVEKGNGRIELIPLTRSKQP